MFNILKYLLFILCIVDGYNTSNFLPLKSSKTIMSLRNNNYNPFIIKGNIIKKIYVNLDKTRAIIIYSDNLINHCVNESILLDDIIFNKGNNRDISIVSNKYMDFINGTLS